MNRLSTKKVSLQSLNIIKERYPMDAKMSNKPYSVEEINTMLDQAEANFAAGLGIPGEVVFRELEEEFAKEEKETELETA